MAIEIFHNPRCRKSREALALLEAKGISPEIVLYLDDVPTAAPLKDLLQKLGMKAEELLRKGEDIYKAHYRGQSLSESEWIEAMVAHPKLIERPIVIKGSKAVVARPPERLLELL
jgi:arsenate reductase